MKAENQSRPPKLPPGGATELGASTISAWEIGRREWDRTTDHHHVKVVLYH